MTKEQFEKELNKIGFKFKWIYPNTFIFNWKWKRMPFRVRSDWLELITDGFDYSITIWFDKIKCQILEWNTLSIQDIDWDNNASLFVQFNNFNLK